MEGKETYKTVLISGTAGFIGSHLCERFLTEGFDVIGVDNFRSGSIENIKHFSKNYRFEFYNFDLLNPFSIDRKIDIVLHFASLASPKYYLTYPVESLLVNSQGTLSLLEIARKQNARFILASTSEVYGDPLQHPQKESYWGNVNPVGVRSVYDEGKRFAESLSMTYFRQFNLDIRIIRIFNTYGPRMGVNDGRVIPNFIVSALKNENLEIYGDGKQTRSFCYIDDLVEGICRIVFKDNIKGEIFNLGNPEEVKVIDLAKKIIQLTDSKSHIIFVKASEDEPRRRCPDISKAKAILDWQPKVSLEEGLIKTVEYFRKKSVYAT